MFRVHRDCPRFRLLGFKQFDLALADSEGGQRVLPPPPPPGKSQVAICFLINTGTDPLAKQLDLKGVCIQPSVK